MASTSTFPNLDGDPLAATGAPGCRCLLVRGSSAKAEVTFEGEEPRTERIGAAPDSDWWLEGCVAPETALVLHWDGDLLWVADPIGHGRATVDGEPLGARWRGLGGTCRLTFPGGALLVECSRPGVVVEVEPRTSQGTPRHRSDVREVLRPPQISMVSSETSTSRCTLGDEPTRPRTATAATLQGIGPGERARPPRVSNPTIPLSDADILFARSQARRSGPLPTEDTTRTRKRHRSSGT